MLKSQRSKSLLVLWIAFAIATNVAAADFNFGGLRKGEAAPIDLSYLSETNFIKFEIFEASCVNALSNQAQYKIIDDAQKKIIFKAKVEAWTGKSGGILILIGTALILTRDESLTKIGIPIAGTGTILIGVSFAI